MAIARLRHAALAQGDCQIRHSDAVRIGRCALTTPFENDLASGALEWELSVVSYGDAKPHGAGAALEFKRDAGSRAVTAQKAGKGSEVSGSLGTIVVEHPNGAFVGLTMPLKAAQKIVDDLQMRSLVPPGEIHAGIPLLENSDVHHHHVVGLKYGYTVKREWLDTTPIQECDVIVHHSCRSDGTSAGDVDLKGNDTCGRDQLDLELRSGSIELEVISKRGLDECLADHLGHTATHRDPVPRRGIDHAQPDPPRSAALPQEAHLETAADGFVDDLESGLELLLQRNRALEQQRYGVPAAVALHERYRQRHRIHHSTGSGCRPRICRTRRPRSFGVAA